MQTNHFQYDFEKSFQRLDNILDSVYEYEEVEEIPDRSKLTYNNGFYVYCNAIFVDIRESSQLPSRYKRPTLARLYKSYISEIVAIMNGYEICKEINIVGDCVSGIFDATKKEHSKNMISIAAQINSLVNTLNYKLEKRGKETIKIGIGISYGRALMVQAGFNGSGIKDIVWMGNVVNDASNLCNVGGKEGNNTIVINKKIYNDLEGVKNVEGKFYQDWFRYNALQNYYHGNVINIEMQDWLLAKKE